MTNYSYNHPLPSTSSNADARVCIADRLELHVRHIVDTLLTRERSKGGTTVYYYHLIPQLVIEKNRHKTGYEHFGFYKSFYQEAKDYSIAFCKCQRGELWLNGQRPSSIAGAIVFLTAGLYGVDINPRTINDQFMISPSSLLKMSQHMVLKRVPLPYGDMWNEDAIERAQHMQEVISRECNIIPSIFTALDYKEEHFQHYRHWG